MEHGCMNARSKERVRDGKDVRMIIMQLKMHLLAGSTTIITRRSRAGSEDHFAALMLQWRPYTFRNMLRLPRACHACWCLHITMHRVRIREGVA